MDCDRLVVTSRVGIVEMVGTVGELGGDWGMVWVKGLGSGVSDEDIEKWIVDIGGVQVQGIDCYRWEGGSWERFVRSYWRVYYIGTF